MIKMTKKTEYALMVLKYMNNKPTQMSSTAKEISEELRIPFDTTSKMMQLLKQNSILNSIQGVKGGYIFAKNLDEITYYEFSKLVGDSHLGLQCLDGNCELESTCNISSPMKKLNQSMIDFFSKLTLKELLT